MNTKRCKKTKARKKAMLSIEQIHKAFDLYHTWQDEGTVGAKYAVPELYRSVNIKKIEENNWSLVSSKKK